MDRRKTQKAYEDEETDCQPEPGDIYIRLQREGREKNQGKTLMIRIEQEAWNKTRQSITALPSSRDPSTTAHDISIGQSYLVPLKVQGESAFDTGIGEVDAEILAVGVGVRFGQI